MFWRPKKQREVLPWYRARGYKGDLTEAEKREVDSFRVLPKHPAAQYEDLPDEVQQYIAEVEIERYDLKQDKAAASAFVGTGAEQPP
jgi:hypothetical protein